MRTAFYWWRATRKSTWRAALTLAFIGGLLGAVALGAAYIGLDANPVVHGHVVDSFLTNDLIGSDDGPSFTSDYFRQDRMTVLAGKLPKIASTNQIALTHRVASLFGVSVGGRVTYQFYRPDERTQSNRPTGRVTFLVTAIADIPPVLVDQ
jgi:hypothetical protein